MELTIDRDDALRAVTFARSAAARRSTIPILSSVRLTASDGGLAVSGSDLGLELATSAPAAVTSGGDWAVNSDRLHGALGSLLSGDAVRLALDKKSKRLAVQCGRARFQIPAEPGSDCPVMAPDAEIVGAELPAADLLRLLDGSEFAVSRDATRPYLCGAYVHRVGDALRSVGTDGAMLSFADIPCPVELRDQAGIILPIRPLAALREMAKGGGSITIGWTPTLFVARSGDNRLTSKVLDAAYPDYARIIPEPPHACRFSRTAFSRALQRCLSATDERVRGVRLSVSPGGIELTSRGERGEEAADFVEAEGGEEFEASFNGKLLAAIIDSLPGEEATMGYSDRASPITITDPNDPGRLAVIIGMRTE